MLQLQEFPRPKYNFPSAFSSFAERVKQENDYWLSTQYAFLPKKMILKYQLSNFGYLSARCLPDISEYEQLSLAAEFMLLGTIYDDYYEFESPENLEHMRGRIWQVLNGASGALTDSVFVKMFAALGAKLLKTMGATWMARFSGNVDVWLASMKEELPFKEPNHFPDLDYFFQLRERTIGVQAYLDLIEMQLPCLLSDDVMGSDYMKEIYRLTARIFSWTNDFFSLLKDIGREPLNLVLVVQNEYKLTLEEASLKALQVNDRDVDKLIYLIQHMPEFGSETKNVTKFLHYIGVMIQGQEQWYSIDTQRYKSGGFPELGSFAG